MRPWPPTQRLTLVPGPDKRCPPALCSAWKRNKHVRKVEQGSFTPLVVSQSGEVGNVARVSYKKLASMLAGGAASSGGLLGVRGPRWKRNEHVRKVEQGSFTPLVVSQSGEVGNAARVSYKKLASMLAEK